MNTIIDLDTINTNEFTSFDENGNRKVCFFTTYEKVLNSGVYLHNSDLQVKYENKKYQLKTGELLKSDEHGVVGWCFPFEMVSFTGNTVHGFLKLHFNKNF